MVYAAVAISWRPVSEEMLKNSHIKHFPRYLILKGFFQFLLLGVALNLREEYPATYMAVFIGFCTVWTVYVWVTCPSNYSRFNMWIRLLMTGVLWHCLALLVMDWTGDSNAALATQLVGWGVIACIGVVVQWKRYPSCLLREKAGDIAKLFRFQLGNQVQAGDLTIKSLDYVRDYEPSDQHGADSIDVHNRQALR